MMAMLHFHSLYREQADFMHVTDGMLRGSTAPAFWQQPVGFGNCITNQNVEWLQAGCNCDDTEAAWFCRKTCGLCQQAERQMSDRDITSHWPQSRTV